MKHTHKIIFAFILVVFTTISCKKQLNTSPEGAIVELNSFKAINIALIGCYDGFQSDGYYNNPASSGSGSGWSALPDLMGDDMIEVTTSLGNWRRASEMTYSTDNSIVQEVFTAPYEIASRVNNILQALGTYENDPLVADEAKIVKAQLLAIRAHVHFDLMRYIAPDFGRNSTSLGVPYVTIFDPQKPFANLPPRATVKENYDKIFEDINNSILLFREAGNTSSNTTRSFIDSTVVYAMRARVNYYASDWAAASKDAEVVISLNPLANAADYVAMYTTDGEASPPSEVIWAIPSDNLLRPGGATNGNSPSYRVAESLFTSITSLGGSYVNSVVINSSAPNTDGFIRRRLQKYAGVKSFKVYRTGEMVLIKAEAQQKLGNDVIALASLNDLRTNRDVAVGTETGAALLESISLLRRVELLGEGHRWFDIKRTTKTINRTECGADGFSISNICNIAPTSKGWAFPIPLNDAIANPNLVQNPGY
ncbi:MAG: RagB/SusD family nutrient uptake outer membrane protein [Sphingobacteriales bacterium]|nr:MAG: RagB/SusD family nutrient uptake outer membrane protein [Sphingobacteriales bacterium]